MFRISCLVATAILFGSTNVLAETDGSFVNYESIVSDLRASIEELPPTENTNDWEDVALHGGVGVTTSYVNIRSAGGKGAGILKGVEAHFGTNLFSKRARAEFVFRDYASERVSSSMIADLMELEVRMLYLPDLHDKARLRLGGGVSSRYMDLRFSDQGSIEHSTPTMSLLLGLERRITPTVTIGPDLIYRSSLVLNSLENTTWDAALSLNATF